MATPHMSKSGQIVDLDDYNDEFHPGHPGDEFPPKKPMTKKSKFGGQ